MLRNDQSLGGADAIANMAADRGKLKCFFKPIPFQADTRGSAGSFARPLRAFARLPGEAFRAARPWPDGRVLPQGGPSSLRSYFFEGTLDK